ncbi:MAG: asparagine synthase-related protein [Solirubrobacteraceae bacterium]
MAPEQPPPVGDPPGRALPLSRLELASGYAVGADDDAIFGGPDADGGGDPRAAISARIATALEHTPCCVSFSGGRDSSAILAVATAVARREGLPDPVPVTIRFKGIASTGEAYWQQLVIDHLRLRRWEVIELDEELDLLGPIARRALTEHGLLWPPNAYIHVPVLERAAGGCVLTGFDGDGLLGDWRWIRAQAVIGGRVRPVRRDGLRVALALGPPRARRPFMRPQLLAAVTWLRDPVRRELGAALRADAAEEPRRWDLRLGHYARRRYLRLAVHSLGLLGATRHVELVHPFLDPAFLGALARDGRGAGYGGRTEAMRVLFADVLPEAMVSRREKAEFGPAIWRTEARSFAAHWDGSGLDLELIDPAPLREAWRATSPLFGSSTLIQAAWLAAQAK